MYEYESLKKGLKVRFLCKFEDRGNGCASCHGRPPLACSNRTFWGGESVLRLRTESLNCATAGATFTASNERWMGEVMAVEKHR